jgi:hypothetical protein
MHMFRIISPSLVVLTLLAGGGCSSSDPTFGEVNPGLGSEELRAGQGPSATATGGDAGVADAATNASGSMSLPPSVTLAPTGILLCGSAPCQCNNGIDDDGDGTVDGFDVECTGAIDDDEGSFATGIPGDNRDPKWQDCFFDGNSGAGDDRCRYPTECLTGELPQDDAACLVSQTCRNNCLPRTPNGCDCFGCCAIQLPGGGETHVTLSSSCSMEKIGDADACPPCTPSDSCANECGECELCPGKTLADLPASCTPSPVPPAADPEPTPSDPAPSDPVPTPDPDAPVAPSCDASTPCAAQSDCDTGEFCSLGCCLTVIR